MRWITSSKSLAHYHPPPNKSRVRNLIKLTTFTKHCGKEIKSVWTQSMTEHSWEDNTSFSHTTMSSGFVYTRGNALLPYLSLSSQFAIVTRSDTVQWVSDQELKLRPWLPAFLSCLRPGGTGHSHTSPRPSRKGQSPLCIERSLHVGDARIPPSTLLYGTPRNSPVRVSHPIHSSWINWDLE